VPYPYRYFPFIASWLYSIIIPCFTLSVKHTRSKEDMPGEKDALLYAS